MLANAQRLSSSAAVAQLPFPQTSAVAQLQPLPSAAGHFLDHSLESPSNSSDSEPENIKIEVEDVKEEVKEEITKETSGQEDNKKVEVRFSPDLRSI